MLFFRTYRNFLSSFSAKTPTLSLFSQAILLLQKLSNFFSSGGLSSCSWKTLLHFLIPTEDTGLNLGPVSGSALLAHSPPWEKWLILLVLVWPPLRHLTGVQGHCSTQLFSSSSSPPLISPKAQDQCEVVKHIIGLCPWFWHRALKILGIS